MGTRKWTRDFRPLATAVVGSENGPVIPTDLESMTQAILVIDALIALQTIRARSNDSAAAEVRSRLAGDSSRVRLIAWLGLGLYGVLGVAAALIPASSAHAGWIGWTAKFAAVIVAIGVASAVARGKMKPPVRVDPDALPEGLRIASAEAIAELHGLMTGHPEVESVVERWERSGHPIRNDQVAAALSYLEAKTAAEPEHLPPASA